MVSDGYCLYWQWRKSRLNNQLINIGLALQSCGSGSSSTSSSSIGGAIDTNPVDEFSFCANLVVKAWKVVVLS